MDAHWTVFWKNEQGFQSWYLNCNEFKGVKKVKANINKEKGIEVGTILDIYIEIPKYGVHEHVGDHTKKYHNTKENDNE